MIETFAVIFPLALVIAAFMRGVMYEFMQVMAWIGGIAVAEALFPTTRPLVSDWFGSSMWTDFIAVALVALPIAVMVSIFSRAITNEISSSNMGPINKGLGAVFGFLRGAVLVWLVTGILTWSFYRSVAVAYDSIDHGARSAQVQASMHDVPVNDIMCGRASEPDPKLVQRLKSAAPRMSPLIREIWEYSKKPEDFKILNMMRTVSVSICGT
ncbi:MAG: CvpA family protein [Magnetovibrio sp.]|nr:CvpA family protein [Magnetovibrio sp.]